MRVLTSTVLSLWMLALPSPARAADDRPHGLVDALVRAWNAHDVKAIGDLFTEDADFINSDGQWSKGRPWIRAQLERWHGGRFKGTTLVETNTTLRMAHPDVAVLHLEWELPGEVDAAGKPLPTRHAIMQIVAVPKVGGWKILSAQDTRVPPPE